MSAILRPDFPRGPAYAGDRPTAIHHVQFHRNTRDDTHRAICTCGWMWFGTLDDVQRRAATHDLDEWQAVDPSAPAAGASP